MVVGLGCRHSQCWALIGMSGWWCWGLVHSLWCWVLIAIHTTWRGSSFTVHATGPLLPLVVGGTGSLSPFVQPGRGPRSPFVLLGPRCCWGLVVLGPCRHSSVEVLAFVDGVAGCSLHYSWVVVVPLIGFCVPWCMAPRHGPCHHWRVRVMGCCLFVGARHCSWVPMGSRWWMAVAFIGLVMWHCRPSCCGGCGQRMCMMVTIDGSDDEVTVVR